MAASCERAPRELCWDHSRSGSHPRGKGAKRSKPGKAAGAFGTVFGLKTSRLSITSAQLCSVNLSTERKT